MKIDLHCHSKHSKRPSLWIMQKLGIPESFTDPVDLYQLARAKGMDAVTVTDHNVIDACLDIAHLPNTFISCEYTTYFPEDRCKLHVLAYRLTEAHHRELSLLRENIFEFLDYLREHDIFHVCAHPLFAVNDRLTFDHVEKMVLLFKNWEWNGDLVPRMNTAVRHLIFHLTPETIDRLVEKHNILPRFPEPWVKNLTAGSDDHSSLHLAETYTEVLGANTVSDFFDGIIQNRTVIRCKGATPRVFGRKVYGISYQFYKDRLQLDRHLNKSLFLRFMDKSLQAHSRGDHTRLGWFHLLLSRKRSLRAPSDENASFFSTARFEAEKLILSDPELLDFVSDGRTLEENPDERWFEFVNRVSDKILEQFSRRVFDRLLSASFFDLFHSLGSAGSLYALLAPYFVGYSLFRAQKAWSNQVLEHFGCPDSSLTCERGERRLAHFTDTFHDVNGVARTLRQHLESAERAGKDYRVLTCHPAVEGDSPLGLVQFEPVGKFVVPDYEDQLIFFPPFLRMLDYCYREEITHIHVSTPGPVGVAGLAIARILRIPVAGTYHTSFPQFAKVLTEDSHVEEFMWRVMMWFYEQMDETYAPSEATGSELVERGIRPEKIRSYPRGVDIERFHPCKAHPGAWDRFGLRSDSPILLYVGRVSKEKNLPLVVETLQCLRASGDEPQLVVVGDGPFRKEMEADLASFRCHFTGILEGEDLARAYASCDLLVFPSTTDTFGNVVLEAQASGVPVVVSDKGGPCENVIPGVTARVVSCDDRPEEFVHAVRSLVNRPELLSQMGMAARKYAETRSFDSAFQSLWSLYTGTESGKRICAGDLPELIEKAAVFK